LDARAFSLSGEATTTEPSREATVMSDPIDPLIETFAFNSRVVSLAAGDLSNQDATRRWKKGTGSSISYLVGHLCSSRYGLLKLLGVAHANPFAARFGAGVGSSDGGDYPTIAELTSRWRDLAGRLHGALTSLTPSQLDAEAPTAYPISDRTVRGALAFICWHESYHVGQVGILRTEMGYPSIQERLSESRPD
jgi:uncharacterized damage-inducible protein DinB